MNALVREAGISKGSLFQYFRTKLDLFDSLLSLATDHVKRYLRKTRDSTEGQPLTNRLSSLIMAGFDFIDTHPQLAKIYFRQLQVGDTPFGAKRLRLLYQQSIDFLTRLLETAHDKGEIRSDTDIRRCAFLLHGLMQHLLNAYYTEHVDSGLGLYQGPKRELKEWVHTMVQLVSHGIVNQVHPREIEQ